MESVSTPTGISHHLCSPPFHKVYFTTKYALVAFLFLGILNLSTSQSITIIQLNESVGYVIDSLENATCRCIPYVSRRQFSYGALIELPDSLVALRIKVAGSEGYRNIKMSKSQVDNLYTSILKVKFNLPNIDSTKEDERIKEIARKYESYQLTDYRLFNYPETPAYDQVSLFQKDTTLKNNAVYGVFGTMVLYISGTVFYERTIRRAQNWPMVVFGRAGYGGYRAFLTDPGSYILVECGILTGAGKSHLEASLGMSYFGPNEDLGVGNFTPALSFGYRRQWPGDEYVFRTGIGWPETLYIGFGFAF